MPEGEGEGQEAQDGAAVSGEHGADGADPDHDMAGDGAAPPAPAPQGERQPNKDRITTPYLTKYERARILGTRALQIRCVTPQGSLPD